MDNRSEERQKSMGKTQGKVANFPDKTEVALALTNQLTVGRKEKTTL